MALDKPVTFDAVTDRPRRRRAARLHLRHHRRAQGDDAFPSRPADHCRRLREGSAGRDAGRRVRRLAAACLHLRPRRAGGLSAAVRRNGNAAGNRFTAQHDRDHRDLQGNDLLYRADRLSRHAARPWTKARTCRRCGSPYPPARRCPARCSTSGKPKTGKAMLDGIGSTELLHIFISNRFGRPRLPRPAPRSLATRPWWWTRT